MISQCGRASEMMPRSFEKKFIRNLQVCKNNAYLCSAQALKNGSIAQLVQSICLTSRGSGVRIPLLPLRQTTRLSGFVVLMRLASLRQISVCVGCVAPRYKKREHSSAGSEYLPYKQRVRGSNPFAPTLKTTSHSSEWLCCF